MKFVLATVLTLAGSAVPALADDIVCMEPVTSPSIVFLGDPCDVQEPETEVTAEDAAIDRNVALVDERGMPTSMPVVMRPSMDTAPAEPAVASAPSAPATPAAEVPQTPVSAEPQVEQPVVPQPPMAKMPTSEKIQ